LEICSLIILRNSKKWHLHRWSIFYRLMKISTGWLLYRYSAQLGHIGDMSLSTVLRHFFVTPPMTYRHRDITAIYFLLLQQNRPWGCNKALSMHYKRPFCLNTCAQCSINNGWWWYDVEDWAGSLLPQEVEWRKEAAAGDALCQFLVPAVKRLKFAAANQTTEPTQITSSKSTLLISVKNTCIIGWSPNKKFPC